MIPHHHNVLSAAGLGCVARRVIVLGALWWAFTAGQPFTVWFSVVAVAAATASAWLLPPSPAGWGWRVGGLVRFIPFFLVESVRGGIDVARRAFSPAMPLDPALHRVPLRLRSDNASIFLAHVVSLLPGTLSAELVGNHLQVHALSGSADAILADTRRLEFYVSRLFAAETPLERKGAA